MCMSCFDGPGCELICLALCRLKMNRILKEGRKFLPLFLVLERRGGEIKGLGKVRCTYGRCGYCCT